MELEVRRAHATGTLKTRPGAQTNRSTDEFRGLARSNLRGHARQRTVTVEAARGGDESAFERLVEPYQGELHHRYRMLGSVHDAEDALQDAMLRAWRGLGKFEGRNPPLRSWLYTIAATRR